MKTQKPIGKLAQMKAQSRVRLLHAGWPVAAAHEVVELAYGAFDTALSAITRIEGSDPLITKQAQVTAFRLLAIASVNASRGLTEELAAAGAPITRDDPSLHLPDDSQKRSRCLDVAAAAQRRRHALSKARPDPTYAGRSSRLLRSPLRAAVTSRRAGRGSLKGFGRRMVRRSPRP